METKFTYNPNGTIATMAETGELTTSFAYNHRRQPTSITYPGGHVTRYKYNPAGRITDVGNALEEYAQSGVDIAENSVSTKSTRHIPTLSNGTLAGTEDGTFSTQVKLDSLGRPYTVSGNGGQIVDYRYDGNGNVTSIKDQTGREIVKTYDAQGRLESIKEPDRGTTKFQYDLAGRLEYVTDPRGLKSKRPAVPSMIS